MKKITLFTFFLLGFFFTMNAQESAQEDKKEFMQITTVESVVAGGLGRSKVVITNADGSQKEMSLENLFSLSGINFNNIKANEEKIIKILRDYTEGGWTIYQVTPFTLSPGNSGQGIFMTRYLLSKPENK